MARPHTRHKQMAKGNDMQQFDIVVFEVRRDADGLYMATSPQLTGVSVVHRDEDRIIADMPNIVQLWYRRHRGIEVEVFWGKRHDTDHLSEFPVIPVPAEIAAQAMAR